jgi:hypothetical protein
LCEVHFTLVKVGLTCRFSLRLCVLLLPSYFFFSYLCFFTVLLSVIFYSLLHDSILHPLQLPASASGAWPCRAGAGPGRRPGMDHSMVELGRDSRGRRGGREAVAVATPGDLRPRLTPACTCCNARLDGRTTTMGVGRWQGGTDRRRR